MSDARTTSPSFDELVGLIKKLFTDYLEDVMKTPPSEIVKSWERYKTLNHLYQDESPAEQPVEDHYDTLYYMVLPVLHKLRHRTDNDTRMAAKGSEIRETIQNTIAEIKKLPQPKSANEPPFLVQSAAPEQPVREVEHCAVFVPCTEDDPDCCGGYTSNDDRSLCYVKEILLPASAFKQPPAEWSGGKEVNNGI